MESVSDVFERLRGKFDRRRPIPLELIAAHVVQKYDGEVSYDETCEDKGSEM